jgi:hypothetical protein
LGALKVTFDLFRPYEEKTTVKDFSSVVDQLSIVVKVFLNSSPGPHSSDSGASNPQGVRIVFHGGNATPVPQVAKGRVAVDCAARLQKLRPILSTWAELARRQG